MFWKKKDSTTVNNLKDQLIAVASMPREFYGGANPVVKFKNVEKEVLVGRSKPTSALTPLDKKIFDKSTAVGSGQPLHPVTIFSNKRLLIIGSLALFVMVLSGLAWYYWNQAVAQEQAKKKAIIIVPPPIVKNVAPGFTPAVTIVTTTSATAIITTSTTETIVPTTTLTLLRGGTLEFPSTFLGDSIDSDHDSLTDAEEEIFHTDPLDPDTDKDGFTDGQEVFNLYSPIKVAPALLIDDGTVTEYRNPNFHYTLYYPTPWIIGSVDSNSRDVLFSTANGEYIEVREFDKDVGQSFDSWLADWAPKEKQDQLIAFKNRFKEAGLKRSDELVHYFVEPQKVFVILYHAVDNSPIHFRMIIKMMSQSFRREGNNNKLTPAMEETTPPLPAATTTSSTKSAATQSTTTFSKLTTPAPTTSSRGTTTAPAPSVISSPSPPPPPEKLPPAPL